ncbi:hypothetical protein EAS61_30145 [Bradyrhizobium zhanjiangense]|uniref:Uncharacterized protein n=1 Tax=Bradyrhizobium zhanjiangense TaxID=1325107 RepID=A0A4Q0QDT5_9BRAD|nr:hypothetical protein EAS61_30145 [Bradyrhizobium zhanjiangense]
MRLDSCDGGGKLPLPLAGDGWGEGASAMGQSPRGENPHPALRRSRGFASASLEARPPMVAYASPASGRGERARGNRST